MNAAQIRMVVTMYDDTFRSIGWSPGFCSGSAKKPDLAASNEHARWMCQEVLKMLEEPDPKILEKANRWLGFIQAILWCNGEFSIDEMRTHNRSV